MVGVYQELFTLLFGEVDTSGCSLRLGGGSIFTFFKIMLKIFFDRASPFVYAFNGLSLFLILLLLWQGGWNGGVWLGPVTVFLMGSWVFFNALNWIPWYGRKLRYPEAKGKLGIRLHFQKNIVPMAYILPIAFLLKWAGVGEWFLLPFALLFLPMYYVSVILLFFHFRDSSDLMPGYFSHNFYLKDEEGSCIH
jgi:hypothetical protein